MASNVTTFQPRTYAVRKALEHYAKLHPSQAKPAAVQSDLKGFITDLLVDLYHLSVEENLQLHFTMEDTSKQATDEGDGQ